MNIANHYPRISSLKSFSQGAGLLTIFIGGLVLLSWAFGVPNLQSILPELGSMKVNTAAAFVIAGLVLWLLINKSTQPLERRMIQFLAFVIALLGLITLCEYMFGWQLRIDEWLFKDTSARMDGSLTPGRMSPVAALNFLLLGSAFLFSNRGTTIGHRLSHFLALSIILLSALPLFGYLYNATALYGVDVYHQIALLTAVTFIIAAAGLLCIHPDRGLMGNITSENAGSFMARRLLPTAIIFPIILGWLWLQGQRDGFYDTELGLALMIGCSIIFFTGIIWWNAGLLNTTDAELKLALAADLRQNEERLRYVIWATRDAIWDRTMSSGEIWWNEGVRKLFRYALNEIEPTVSWWQEHIHPEDRQKVLESIQDIIETGQKFWSKEYRFQHADGSYANIFDRAYIIYDEQTGQAKRMIGAMSDITAQKQADLALHQSQELFSKVFSGSPVGITLTRQADGQIIEVNEACLKMLGYSHDEVLGKKAFELGIILEDQTQLVQMFSGTGVIRDVEIRVLTKSGELKTILSSFEKLEVGGDPCILSIIYDITERKQMETALQESEERYRLMIDNIKDYAIFLLDAQGNVKTWNAGAEHIKGYSADEIIGRPSSIFYPKEDIESGKPAQLLKKAAAEGHAEDDGWRVRKDGSRFWANVTVTALHNEEGQLRGFSKVTRNITEHKLAEDARQQSEALFRGLFELSPDAVVVIDPHDPNNLWPIIDCNATTCLMNGYEHDELIGQSIDILNGKSDTPAERETYIKRLRAQGTLNAEFSHRHKNGTFFPIETSTTLITIGEREVIIGIDRDITARKRAEDLLNHTNEKLKNGLAELDQRNREMMLLNELGNQLQICQTVEEAYTIMNGSVSKIFPETNGALYMINPSRDFAEAATVWGTISPDEHTFSLSDCFALRRGRSHFVDEDHPSLQCKHLAHHPTAYICVPMMSQGESLGIFHLQYASNQPQKSQRFFEQGLVETVADTIALALTNLRLRETLRKQSVRDPLTGLFNRRFMEESLDREIHQAARTQRSLGIIMLDVDHFKKFNDTFGHDAGDVVLRELGEFLKHGIRKGDIACRYGGEEFLLLLPEATLENTCLRAQKLCDEIKNVQIQHRGNPLGHITISVGVAVFPVHGQHADDVIRAADRALYRAKEAGRNQVVVAVLDE